MHTKLRDTSAEIADDLACVAAILGDTNLLEHLLQKNVDFNKESDLFHRPLISAAKAGHEQACQFLLRHGANPNSVHQDVIAQRQQYRSREALGLQLEHYDDALRAACRGGHLSVVRLLFEPVNGLHFSPGYDDVLLVATRASQAEILEFLFNKADFPLLEEHLGPEILRTAAKVGSTAIVKMMLDGGVHVNMESEDRKRRLECAAWRGHEGTVRLLLDRGAKFDCLCIPHSAITDAAHGGHLSVVKTLLEYGADVNTEWPRCNTPLYQAAIENRIQMVNYLLRQGADPFFQGCGYRALDQVAFHGNEEMIRILHKAGLKINGPRTDGRRCSHPPVARAMSNGKTSTVQLLLELGAEEVDPLTTAYRTGFLDGTYPRPKPPLPLLGP